MMGRSPAIRRLVAAGWAILASTSISFPAAQKNPAPLLSRSKRPETIDGKITIIRPDEGIVVVVRTGPFEPKMTQLTWTETRDPVSGRVEKSPMSVTEVPGETDYAFKITPRTLIEINGQRTSVEHLARSRNKPATVRFLPERKGDFALEIRVRE